MIENQQIYQVLFPFYENYLALHIDTFKLSDLNLKSVVEAALEKDLIKESGSEENSKTYQFTEQGLKFMASQDNNWDAF